MKGYQTKLKPNFKGMMKGNQTKPKPTFKEIKEGISNQT
jgi:hypothetical protein